jgi:hypothetical protein
MPTGTFSMDGGTISADVAYTDGQVQLRLAPPMFSTGTWVVTEVSYVPTVTRTAANTTEYYAIPILVPSRTTALKGIKLKSVTIVVTLGGTLDTSNDDFQIDILKVTTPADASDPTGTVLAGNESADYETAHNDKAKRLTAATHTMVVTIPSGERAFVAAGEQYFVRILVKDNAGTNLTCALVGATAQFDFIPL